MSQLARKSRRPIKASPVVLDTVGLLRRRGGTAVLRLKIVGPVDKLRGLKVEEGDHLRVFTHTLAVA